MSPFPPEHGIKTQIVPDSLSMYWAQDEEFTFLVQTQILYILGRIT